CRIALLCVHVVRRFCCLHIILLSSSFLFTAPAPTEIYTLSLHDALPIWWPFAPGRVCVFPSWSGRSWVFCWACSPSSPPCSWGRSEEHTSELQSRFDLVCRLLLEKKKTPTKHSGH